jgi:hypothetical protein
MIFLHPIGGFMLSRTIVAVCLSSITLSFAQMQPVVSGAQGNGNIDWAKRSVISTGIGAPNPDLPKAAQRPAALRAAQQISLRNALETIKGIYLNSTTTVNNFMVSNDQINSSVSGFVQGFQQQGNPKYMSDGSVEVTMSIPLDGIGGIGDILLGTSVGSTPSITSFEKTTGSREIVFTGLIIDCKGYTVKPALSPRVLDENDREVYGSAYVSREWAVKNGVVGYSKDVQAAAKLADRIGSNPGQIKAKKVAGANGTDIIITNKDADDIRSASKNLKFLSECRVIFVID